MITSELRQRLFRFATGPFPRLEARSSQPLRSARRAFRAGMLIVCSLTVWLLAWLGYHWFMRPDWLQALPELVRDVIHLTETAGTFTVALVWAGLAWRHWRQMNGTASSRDVSSARRRLYELSPGEFEGHVAELFRKKGYEVILRGGSGDRGVDLELSDRRTGRRAIVQCKRYQNTVGAETIRELYGTLLHELAYHAFLVTTADISDAARSWAQGKPMTLIDGATLARIDHSLRIKSAARDV